MKTLPDCLTKPASFVPAEGGTSKWVEAIFISPRFRAGSVHRQRAWIERRHLAAAVALGFTLVVVREADELP